MDLSWEVVVTAAAFRPPMGSKSSPVCHRCEINKVSP